MKYTQYQKIIGLMCKYPEKWFYPYDFMQEGFYFVGYKAPTRIAELANEYPNLFVSRTRGKYVQRKLNTENSDWFYDLPKDLRFRVHRSGLSKYIKPKEVQHG